MAKVQTVLGPVSPSVLGRTLTHEHFSLDFSHFHREPPAALASVFKAEDERITLRNVGFIRQYPYSSSYNILFNDKDTHDAVQKDVEKYKFYGGGTIVENTTYGLQRNLPLMTRISRDTGVHVIAGTGHYVAALQTANTLHTSHESLCTLMTTELTTGCTTENGEVVKCGFIGEVGSGWPLHDFEKRAIQATASVQETLGCPVSFHPCRNPLAPAEIIRLHLEAGGKKDKTVMSHLDRTFLTSEEVLEFASLGCYCQFDLFGTECSYYQLNPSTDMPSDAQRLRHVVSLIDDGSSDRVLLSHDIHTKHRLMEFGGHGFSHIINNILPRLLLKGVPQEIIDQISIENPRNWLQYNLK